MNPIVGYLGDVGMRELSHLLGFVLEALDHAAQDGRWELVHADELDTYINIQVTWRALYTSAIPPLPISSRTL